MFYLQLPREIAAQALYTSLYLNRYLTTPHARFPSSSVDKVDNIADQHYPFRLVVQLQSRWNADAAKALHSARVG